MFEPPPRRRRPWVWPVLVSATAATLAAAVAFGGPWYLLVLAGVLIWGFFAVRFLQSSRGKGILFGRFDDYEPPRRN
jgi:hypothetical protein